MDLGFIGSSRTWETTSWEVPQVTSSSPVCGVKGSRSERMMAAVFVFSPRQHQRRQSVWLVTSSGIASKASQDTPQSMIRRVLFFSIQKRSRWLMPDEPDIRTSWAASEGWSDNSTRSALFQASRVAGVSPRSAKYFGSQLCPGAPVNARTAWRFAGGWEPSHSITCGVCSVVLAPRTARAAVNRDLGAPRTLAVLGASHGVRAS